MISKNDPRLTAYALGELAGDERTAFEAELRESPEAEREVSEIRALATMLEGELAGGAPLALTDAERAKVTGAVKVANDDDASSERSTPEAASPNDAAPLPRVEKLASVTPLRRRGRWLLAAAPLALAAAVAGVIVLRSDDRSRSSFGVRAKGDAAMHEEDMAEKPMATASPLAASSASPNPSPPPLAEPESSSMNQRTGRRFESKAKADFDVDGRDAFRDPSGPDAGPISQDSKPFSDNPFIDSARDKQSTFSVDVDTASYSMLRRSLTEGRLPDPSAVRIEEMVNYFSYSYAPPNDEAFGVSVDAAEAPWAKGHRLVRIGLQGKQIEMAKRPASNLVFLLDVSGSMTGPDRLPLLKQSLSLLVDQLDERDRVSIVVYAGASGVVLEPTAGNRREQIRAALDRLQAGGSTNGGQGIELAYAMAQRGFVEGGANRVILATDGDFNVGVTGQDALTRLVQEKAKGGTFLTVLGFGRGNYKDTTMESLADKGNGNYAYIDTLAEANKVLVEQASGTLHTIAKDVKIQITFDPAAVQSFRLIGYENRVMAHQDFANDKKDAGDIGAGHRVTALYEIVPASGTTGEAHLGDVALRYKMPDGTTSRLLQTGIVDHGATFADATTDFRFAASVAGFGMLLRGSPYRGTLEYGTVRDIANGAVGDDPDGYRKAFVGLVDRAKQLAHGD